MTPIIDMNMRPKAPGKTIDQVPTTLNILNRD